MKKSNTLLLVVILSVGAFGLGWWLNHVRSTTKPLEHPIEGLLWPQVKTLKDFALLDHQGQPFTLANFKGKWSLVFFGYTRCPDVCPTTLQVLQGVKKQLETHTAIAASTQFVFISVDGQRDAPAVLASYVKFFDPAFIGAMGMEEQIQSLTQQIGTVYMQIPDPNNKENYLIDHSASVFLIDPLGKMIGLFSAPHAVDTITTRYLAMRNFLAEHY